MIRAGVVHVARRDARYDFPTKQFYWSLFWQNCIVVITSRIYIFFYGCNCHAIVCQNEQNETSDPPSTQSLHRCYFLCMFFLSRRKLQHVVYHEDPRNPLRRKTYYIRKDKFVTCNVPEHPVYVSVYVYTFYSIYTIGLVRRPYLKGLNSYSVPVWIRLW